MTIGELAPGDVVLFENLSQLSGFEDMVAEYIDPDMDYSAREAWAGRMAVKEMLRPPKFYGSVININLVAIPEPFDELVRAAREGGRFRGEKGVPIPKSISQNPDVMQSYLGFRFLADAKTSGKGVIGQIQAGLWYGKVPPDEVGRPKAKTHGGRSVQRYVTKALLEKARIVTPPETSRRIGYHALRRG